MDTTTPSSTEVTDWFDEQKNVDLCVAWMLTNHVGTARDMAEFLYRPYEHPETYHSARTWEIFYPIEALLSVAELTRTGDADPD
jgi:hypothetical protein